MPFVRLVLQTLHLGWESSLFCAVVSKDIDKLTQEIAELRSQIKRLTRACENLLKSHIRINQDLKEHRDNEKNPP